MTDSNARGDKIVFSNQPLIMFNKHDDQHASLIFSPNSIGPCLKH